METGLDFALNTFGGFMTGRLSYCLKSLGKMLLCGTVFFIVVVRPAYSEKSKTAKISCEQFLKNMARASLEENRKAELELKLKARKIRAEVYSLMDRYRAGEKDLRTHLLNKTRELFEVDLERLPEEISEALGEDRDEVVNETILVLIRQMDDPQFTMGTREAVAILESDIRKEAADLYNEEEAKPIALRRVDDFLTAIDKADAIFKRIGVITEIILTEKVRRIFDARYNISRHYDERGELIFVERSSENFKPYEKIGDSEGISGEQVRQYLNQAEESIRSILRKKNSEFFSSYQIPVPEDFFYLPQQMQNRELSIRKLGHDLVEHMNVVADQLNDRERLVLGLRLGLFGIPDLAINRYRVQEELPKFTKPRSKNESMNLEAIASRLQISKAEVINDLLNAFNKETKIRERISSGQEEIGKFIEAFQLFFSYPWARQLLQKKHDTFTEFEWKFFQVSLDYMFNFLYPTEDTPKTFFSFSRIRSQMGPTNLSDEDIKEALEKITDKSLKIIKREAVIGSRAFDGAISRQADGLKQLKSQLRRRGILFSIEEFKIFLTSREWEILDLALRYRRHIVERKMNLDPFGFYRATESMLQKMKVYLDSQKNSKSTRAP
jgi:hypothetical protein